jgi:hypothetical protein
MSVADRQRTILVAVDNSEVRSNLPLLTSRHAHNANFVPPRQMSSVLDALFQIVYTFSTWLIRKATCV